MAMFANNLSTLGVSASQIDNRMDTQSFSVQWLPTTGEFGLWNGFGDYDAHEKLATRIGVHYSHSLEEKQSQPGTEGIENSQIRLTDGSVIFTPNLFGPGITVNEVDYRMSSVDAGVKYKGMAVEGEYYWRWLSNFTGINTSSIANINDTGYQLQTSAMVVPKALQLYFGASQIFGDYGDPWEVRVGRELVPDEEARDSSQRRMDVRGRITRGIHGLSLPRRRQGPGVPHQPRAELLIGEVSMTRMPWFRSAAVAGAFVALALVLSFVIRARPLAAQDQGAANEFNDSHFHLTNYIQQGIEPRQFLADHGEPREPIHAVRDPTPATVVVRQLRRLCADLLPSERCAALLLLVHRCVHRQPCIARCRQPSRRASIR